MSRAPPPPAGLPVGDGVSGEPQRRKTGGQNWISIAEACGVLAVLVAFGVYFASVEAQVKIIDWGSTCVSNVKQISLSNIMYAGDWDDTLPGRNWMDLDLLYLKNNSIYSCPDIGYPTPGVYGYAMDQATVGVKSTSFPHPEQQPMIFDSELTGRNEVGGTWLLPSPGRHNGADTIGFADGHAKRIPNP